MSSDLRAPRVAIIGRPNVGKSTLLNRFLGRREAIVQELPGVTRDRREHRVEWGGRSFLVVDTGGWEPRADTPIGVSVREQAQVAVAGSDVVVLVADGKVGVTAEDADVARLVRKSGLPVMLVVNKIDGPGDEHILADYHTLGLGEPHPVSALHGRRSGDVLDTIIGLLPEEGTAEDDDVEASVAIVGRPNVGKSTLFNRLVGDERTIVHDMPGTTRDAIDSVVELDGSRWRFVDTAGLRRRARVDTETEYYSRVRALQALQRADVALLMIDATAGVTAADQKVAEEIVDAGRACIVILNKWDALDAEQKAPVEEDVADMLRFLSWAVLLRISARTGQRVHRLAEALTSVLAQYRRRIPTNRLVRVVEAAQQRHAHPLAGRRSVRIRYVTQPSAEPPLFVLFATHRLQTAYVRYIEGTLRREFGFEGTPIRIKVKVREPKGRKS